MGGFQGPLDAHTAGMAGAWSVARRLLTSYSGPLIRVRRSSDNAELDVNANAAGALNATTLLAFVGGSSGWVSKIYDQSGLARDLAQGTAAAQRRIVNAGSLVTLSGEPAIEATAESSQGYLYSLAPPDYIFGFEWWSTTSMFAVASLANGPATFSRVSSLISDQDDLDYTGGGLELARYYGNEAIYNSNYNTQVFQPIVYDSRFVVAFCRNNETKIITTDAGSSTGATSLTIAVRKIGAAGPFSSTEFRANIGDKWQAQVLYGADKTSDIPAIREALS